MSKTILIVDDEELILENLEALLKDQADNIYTALNGELALEILKREQIHCVISDIKMPVMDGIELIKQARGAGFEIPFIFFTAHGNSNLMMEAVKYGAFDFIDKPNFNNLEETVLRGLQEGFKISNNESIIESNSEKVFSEYRKLLGQKSGSSEN